MKKRTGVEFKWTGALWASNAAQAIELVDHAYIYDNSVENVLPQLLYRTVDGEVLKQYTDDVPEWAEMFLK